MGSKRINFGVKKNRKSKIRMKNCNMVAATSNSLQIGQNKNGNKHLSNLNKAAASISIADNSEEGVVEGTDLTDEDIDMVMEGNNSDANDPAENVSVAEVIGLDICNDDDVSAVGSDNDEYQIEGRRIVEMNFLLNQVRDISQHNSECTLNDVQIDKEIRSGLDSKIILQCKNCAQKFQVFNTTGRSDTSENMCINSTAVLASNMIGIGYSQMEQFASVLNVPVMCSGKYKALNDKVGGYWEETAMESMKAAAEEERLAAIARGDVDDDGIPYITVVTDGCWSKRSYNKNFTALSGVSAIVGFFTGKVLWIGVRNKYCVICVRHANKNLTPPEHFCTRNFSGPSSDMEWQSILEGFQSSVAMYNLRYSKMVADGDSSTYLKLMERKPYGNRYIEKFECKNHLLRNYRTQIGHASTGCPRGLKTHVCKSFERIRKDICSAIQHRQGEDTSGSEKVLSLKSDLNNVIHHVFGDHSNCPSYIQEFCKDDANHIPALKKSGTYEKLAQPMRRLIYCASDLILGLTNNIAEQFNSIVAKFVGAKRVNFSLSNSYKHKSNASVVHFNEKLPLSALFRKKFNSKAPSVANKIEVKRLRKSEREKARRKRNKENKIFPKRFCRNKEVGSGYGVNCQQPDLSAADFEAEKKILTEKLKINQRNRLSIEEKTREKYCPLYQDVLNIVIMASDFGSICKAKNFAKYVKEISLATFAKTKAMKHEEDSLPFAIQQLTTEENIIIKHCGLIIDSEHMCLAAYPTGVVNTSNAIVNIQCPLSIFNKDPDPSLLAELPYMELGSNKKTVSLNKSDNLYYQIQGQLQICNADSCYLAIWTSTQHKMYVERIVRDKTFFETKMKTQLLSFYNDWLLPELVDPRLSRNMSVRVPGSTTSAEG